MLLMIQQLHTINGMIHNDILMIQQLHTIRE